MVSVRNLYLYKKEVGMLVDPFLTSRFRGMYAKSSMAVYKIQVKYSSVELSTYIYNIWECWLARQLILLKEEATHR